MRKRILAVTGIRSEYDILRPVIRFLRDDKRFEVGVVVSGAHLTEWHGYTVEKIRQDGFKIVDRVQSLLMDNSNVQRAKGAGLLICGLVQAAERYKPDILLVVGDREESIAAAVVGNYMNILVAHIGGGDAVYGNNDDPIRFAVSKLAHIHFVSNYVSANNLKKVGEDKFRIFNVGNPALDNIRLTPRIPLDKISKFLGFNLQAHRFIVLIQHPLSSEYKDAGRQMEITLRSIEEFHRKTGFIAVCIYPNTDPGALDILKAMDKYKNKAFIRFYKTLPREIFINIMRNAAALIGNSSMGLLEAPFYKLPVVNVGNRQKGRLNVGNVEFVDHRVVLIKKALSKACLNMRYRKKVQSLKKPFGNGYTANKIKKVLLSLSLTNKSWYIKHEVR